MNKGKPNVKTSCDIAFCKKILAWNFGFDSFVVYETGNNRFFVHGEGHSKTMLQYYSWGTLYFGNFASEKKLELWGKNEDVCDA